MLCYGVAGTPTLPELCKTRIKFGRNPRDGVLNHGVCGSSNLSKHVKPLCSLRETRGMVRAQRRSRHGLHAGMVSCRLVGPCILQYRFVAPCCIPMQTPERQPAEERDGARTLVFQKRGSLACSKPALGPCRNHESKRRRIWDLPPLLESATVHNVSRPSQGLLNPSHELDLRKL